MTNSQMPPKTGNPSSTDWFLEQGKTSTSWKQAATGSLAVLITSSPSSGEILVRVSLVHFVVPSQWCVYPLTFPSFQWIYTVQLSEYMHWFSMNSMFSSFAQRHGNFLHFTSLRLFTGSTSSKDSTSAGGRALAGYFSNNVREPP